jgi:hypothetical protein
MREARNFVVIARRPAKQADEAISHLHGDCFGRFAPSQ